jgi:hypothetical protein
MATNVNGWYKADCLYSKGITTVSLFVLGRLSTKLPATALEKLKTKQKKNMHRINLIFGEAGLYGYFFSLIIIKK